ncbi:DUF3120 domain-containing protein [Thermosynechococcus sp. HN-54]|uniref:DUF3120 domain-containing protein n=1 Tax=Thermosynechococcus sp. HN-54 TaxID=2933959 RepID=UPI00202CBD7F|nr:DUF3120 domain-containing protein [Thermosynechococcus sp. HN-54]URR35312.1 DUF3120 domain-containing protein [Thermosynechococcus sp. HN-54]
MTALTSPSVFPALRLGSRLAWFLFGFAAFLVSVPVFIEAPLVRTQPWLSLALMPLLLGLSLYLQRQPRYRYWGEMLYGFSWCWGAGSLYWGWLRWEPLWHLPVEALPIPLMVWHLRQRQQLVGVFFFWGSFLGTAITDAYFYLIDVIPHWRAIMYLEGDVISVQEILGQAIAQAQTFGGQLWGVLLSLSLLLIGLLPLFQSQIRRGYTAVLPVWGFMGAVLSTLVVDGLFGLTIGLISMS